MYTINLQEVRHLHKLSLEALNQLGLIHQDHALSPGLLERHLQAAKHALNALLADLGVFIAILNDDEKMSLPKDAEDA
jgi:hypothetical protein